MKFDPKRFQGLTVQEKKDLLLEDIKKILSKDKLFDGAKVELTFREKK